MFFFFFNFFLLFRRRKFKLPINFMTRWMPPKTLFPMSPKDLSTFCIPQTVLAKVQFWSSTEFFRVRTLVPNFHLPFSHFDTTSAGDAPSVFIVIQFFLFLLLNKRKEQKNEIKSIINYLRLQTQFQRFNYNSLLNSIG